MYYVIEEWRIGIGHVKAIDYSLIMRTYLGPASATTVKTVLMTRI